MRFEFGKPRGTLKKSKALYFFNRKSVESSVYYTFTSYQQPKDENDAKKLFGNIFEIPDFCS